MQFRRQTTEFVLTLSQAERELLLLALKRATFEDTPAERQNEILDFALAVLRQIEETPDHDNSAPSLAS